MSFYNNQFTGTNPFYWWIGQVVDEVNWIGNINPKLHGKDDVPGWGPCRCKVRIFGRDTQTKDTPDDQLEMAEVLLPVTAGSGHAGSVQSPNIRQGNYVVGFYKDGIDAREPIIFGVLPNNSQTSLFGGDPQLGFIPRSGYKGKTGQKPVSTKNIYAAGPNSPCAQEACDANIDNIRERDQQKDGNRCHYVPKTKTCDGTTGEVKGIQKLIKQLLGLINRIKAEANGFLGAASDLTAGISQLVNDFTVMISGLFKSLLDRMRGYVVNKLNREIKNLIDLLPPNQRPGANQASETATDTLQCVFNKIIRGLVGLVKKLLEDIIDKYINAPLCAIESFVGNLLSSVLGEITGAIQSAISAVSGIIGKIGDIAGSIFGVFDVVIGVLNFLSCDEPSDCTMGDEWSFWGGAKCATENASAGIKKLSNKIKKAIEGDTTAPPCNTSQIPCGPPTLAFAGGGGSGVLGNPIVSATGSILGIDFANRGSGYVSPPNISVVDNCGIGGGAVIVPIIKGPGTPPKPGQTTIDDNTIVTVGGETTITGGTTTISDGNISSSGGTVVSTAGNTVATTTDGSTTANGGNVVVTGGTSTTLDGVQTIVGGVVTITGGSVTTAGGSTTASTVSGDEGSIINAVVVDPGSGYLQTTDGSTGGNGSVFSKPEQTIVFNDNTGYNVYNPGTVINVFDGDLIYSPPGSITELYDQNGNLGQTIIGEGGTSPITINLNGTITTPNYDPSVTSGISNPSSNGSYPVVLTIGDVAILNGGVNYDPNDKIVISPDNGAELEPVFNDVGKLVDVKVISPGIGFTEFPELYVESQDGLNAVIVPVFGILRVGDLPEDQDIIPPGTQIINVVDCVGKVN